MPVLNPNSSRTGAIELFSGPTPPPGTLRANGAAVSRSVYAKLFGVIGITYGAGDGVTTFNIPDLRGHFPRFWDDGKGVDAGRALGTHQAGQNASHTHTGITDSQGSHAHSGWTDSQGAHFHSSGIRSYGSNTGAGANTNGTPGALINTSTDGAHTHNVGTAAAGVHAHNVTVYASGGNEARPTNIALMGCIVYE